MFKRKKTVPKDPNAIEPTKLNSSQVVVNLLSGNSKKLTKSMASKLKKDGYDKTKHFIFDSGLEARYYIEVLLPDILAGKIIVRMQPKFEIFKKSEKDGVKHMAITYSPDFGVTPIETKTSGDTFVIGKEKFIDVKGMLDSVFPMKRKMFDGAFPDFPPLIIIKYWKAQGGWMTLETFNAVKKAKKASDKLAEVVEE